MSIGVVLVTHDDVGSVLLNTATAMLGMCPLNVELLSVRRGDDPQQLIGKAQQIVEELDQGAGVLVLTDMYGSTPSNVASALLATDSVRIIAGLNLPMLIRILNYPRLTLDELVYKAVQGGREGVMTWTFGANT